MKKSMSTYVKVSLLALLSSLLGLPIMATTVEVTTPGTLESSISNLDEPSFPTLKIVGTLNSDDILYLRSATGRMKTVETLDLSEVTFAADGKAYASLSYGGNGDLMDNYSHTFYLSDENYEETTSMTSNMMGGTNYKIAHYCNDLSGAFSQTNYKKIIMPNYVKKAGDMTFYKCTSLTTVEFPAGLERVGMNAFQQSGIETIDLSRVVEMKSSAFLECSSFIGGADGILDLSSLESIPEFAFGYSGTGLKELKTIKFSKSLISIGDYAFKFAGLTAVDFPESLKEIGNSTFEECNSITSIVLPQSLEKLGNNAFRNCRELASVNILSTTLPLSYNMFTGTPWLNSLQAEDDGIIYFNTTALRYVGDMYNYNEDIKLTFREGTTGIGDEFIDRNKVTTTSRLTSITLPSTLRYIGNNAFSSYGQANEKITNLQLPEGLEEIGAEAFYGFKKLSSVQLPSMLKIIGDKTFSNCTELKTITLPESIKSIGSNAFSFCTYLSGDITIPENVEKLGEGIFDGSSIWRITYLAKNAVNTVASNIMSSVFGGDVERVIIGSKVETLPRNFFVGCSTLQQVIFDERMDNATLALGIRCFYGCSKLQTITLPKGKIVIGGGAFSGCPLEKVEIQGVVTEIQEYRYYSSGIWGTSEYVNGAFQGCEALTEITFLDGLQKVEGWAFAYCNNLKSANLGNSVKYIGEFAFSYCPLTDIQFGNQLDSIGESAFAGTNLEVIDLGEHLKSIGENAFSGSNLQSIKIPGSTKIIGRRAFRACSSLSSIALEEGLEEIGTEAFFNCPIKEQIIPSTVKKIGSEIYGAYASSLKIEVLESHIQNPEEVEYDGDPFYACYSKVTLRVPAGMLETYQSTYPWSQFTKIEEIKGPEYTLTYVVDREVYKTVQVESGKAITPEPEPTKEGYTFSGWSEIPETMPDHDVTVTGSFTVNTYTLTYVVDGEVYKTVQVEYGSAITPEPAPTKEGYTFSGWSEIPETMPDHDVTVTGSFTVNTYTLTYIVDGEIYKTLQLEYGSAITPEPEPTKDGYIFLGWSEIPLTMPAYDVTVTGSYMIVDGIQGILVEDSDYQIFNLNGKRVNTLQKGMNIVRMSNGTVLKVHVK